MRLLLEHLHDLPQPLLDHLAELVEHLGELVGSDGRLSRLGWLGVGVALWWLRIGISLWSALGSVRILRQGKLDRPLLLELRDDLGDAGAGDKSDFEELSGKGHFADSGREEIQVHRGIGKKNYGAMTKRPWTTSLAFTWAAVPPESFVTVTLPAGAADSPARVMELCARKGQCSLPAGGQPVLGGILPAGFL